MGWNKISGGVALVAALPVSLPAGSVFMLPVGQGTVGAYGSATPSPGPGNTIPNASVTGQFFAQLGQLCRLQVYDSALYMWRNVQVIPGAIVPVSSDGTNYRIINDTGSPVGAVITALGSGGTDGFYGYNNQRAAVTIQNGTVTAGNTVFTVATTGGSLWNAIVGGQINTTIGFTAVTLYANLPNWYVSGAPSITGNSGSNYVQPPIIVFGPPPNQGAQPYILPTAVCTISAGAIASVTVINAGAGLLGLPSITVVPQAGDTTGGGAILGWTSGNGTESNAGKCVALWPVFPGTAQTSVPSFTFAGTSNPAPSATAIMNFTLTSITNTTAGSGYTSAYALFQGGITSGTDLTGNPEFSNKNLCLPVFPPLSVVATTGVCTLASNFGGVNIQAIPTIALGTQLAAGTVATVAVQTAVVGGASDTITLMSF